MIMTFRSVRGRSRQIFMLLGIILLLILAGYFIGKRATRWEEIYYRIVHLESILSQVISGDRDVLGNEEKFTAQANDYKQFRSFCTECHAPRTTVIEERLQILRQLHENEKMKIRFKNEVRNLLGELLGSVQYIHEHHIVTLKNFLKGNRFKEDEVRVAVGLPGRHTVRSAPELDIIAQAVAIQNSLTAIFSNFYSFYSLGQDSDPSKVERDFKSNMQSFYRAVNTFEDYSLDAQDGLLVEELLESGRVFEKSIVDLAHLEERERTLLRDLRNNGTAIGVALTRAGALIDHSRQRFNKQAKVMTLASLIIVLVLITLIYSSNREISLAVKRLVGETEKLKMDFSYKIEPESGELEEFRSLSRSLNTMAGHVNEHMVALHREVTDRIVAEKRLAAEKERLDLILQSIGDGVITTDIKGCIATINTVAAELIGWDRADAQGCKIEEVLQLIDEDSGLPVENLMDELVHGETAPGSGTMSRMILIAHDGTRRIVAASGAEIRDRQGEVIGVVLVLRDVSRERQLEEEIIRREKLDSVGVLAGGIAHDFNNILVGIMGNLNLATRLPEPGDQVYPLVQQAEKASQEARDLTQRLLTFAKGGEPVRQSTTIEELIREVSEMTVTGTRVKCTFDFEEGLRPADIDREQVGQVIRNLVINACQAMPEGGIVDIGVENVNLAKYDPTLSLDPGPYLKITVRDNGIGIPDSIVEKIFDPYFTTKQEGSGLGLATCYSVIRRHRGYIGVSSKPGAGTLFTVYVPAVAEAEMPPDSLDEEETERGSGKVLVMDDDEAVCAATRQMLEFFGYTVLTAADGHEAIRFYEEERRRGKPIDAVIMDLTIPHGMGGEEAVQEILALDEKAVVIVSSGYADSPIMANYQDYGFKAALCKPFDLNELTRVVADVLQSKEGAVDRETVSLSI